MSDITMEQFVAISSKKEQIPPLFSRFYFKKIKSYLPVRAAAASDGAGVLTVFLACLR